LNEFAATGADGDGEECERSFAGDALEARAQEDAGGQIDDFARAEANENFFGFYGVAGGKNFAETFAAAVGIPVGFAQSAAGGFHGTRRRAERIFVGGELDGMNLEFLFHLFDRPAGHVGGKALDVIRDELFEGVGHELSLCLG